MAYGFDIEEIYYTDHNLVDIGILDTYEISLDVAGEKDFEIVSPDFVIPVGGFWYVPNTEYGGIIGGRGMDSDEGEVTYTGMGWRGILDEHYVMIPDTADKRTFNGRIDTLVSGLLSECGLAGLYTVDELDLEAGVDSHVDDYVIGRGTTLYEAIIGLADNVIFTYIFEYRPKDKKVHIKPILATDYSEYMIYSNVGAVSYEMEEDYRIPNHYCMTSINPDDNKKRTIHLFTDANGIPQPYLTRQPTPNKPTKDDDYIKDKRNQRLFGVDEVMVYEETDDSVEEHYEVLDKAPADWYMTFGQYYKRVIDDEGEVSYEFYEAEDGEEGPPQYFVLSSKPADWNTNYSSYFTRQWNQEQGAYEYSSVSGTTKYIAGNQSKYKPVRADNTTYANGIQHVAISKVPADWNWNFGEYYWYYWNGVAYEPMAYQSEDKDKYALTTKKPDDWEENYSSYYRHTHIVTEYDWKAYWMEHIKNPQAVLAQYATVKVVDLPYTAENKGKGKWESVEGKKKTVDGKEVEVAPKWAKDKYYTKVYAKTVLPEFKSGNTFHLKTTEVAPTFVANQYYREYIEPAKPILPKYVQGQVFRQVYDHYSHMIEDMLAYFEDNKKTHTEKYTLDDFAVNIGDLVGTRNEITGETLPAVKVTNQNVKIDNGLLTVEYVIGG